MNSTPEGSKQSRREGYREGGEGSPFLVSPDIKGCEYLVSYWHHAGTVSNTGMGIAPLTWSELRAWRLENGMSLEPFEVALIHLMSSEYVAEYHAGSKKGRQSPVEIDEEEIDRDAVASKIGNIFGALLNKQKKRDNNEDEDEG